MITYGGILKPAICITTNTVILLDGGHAECTLGKGSPDGTFKEWKFNREIVDRIANKLKTIGIKYEIITPEYKTDITLSERARRANEYCKKYGTNNCLFISVHSNAAGNGSRWMNARGWSCYTSKGTTKSDEYAEIFMKEAEKLLIPKGQKIRKYSAKKYSWEENFTVLTKTNCPAILTESLFYDNKEDLKFLQSEEGKNIIADIHVNAIRKIFNI